MLALTAAHHTSTPGTSSPVPAPNPSLPQSVPPPAWRPTEPSLAGDAASFLAALVFVGYLHAGRTLRQFMPVFVYACPVTAVAAALLTLCGLLFEGASLFGTGDCAPQPRTGSGMPCAACAG